MLRHRKNCGATSSGLRCDVCGQDFNRKDNLVRHQKKCGGSNVVPKLQNDESTSTQCNTCQRVFKRKHNLTRHSGKCGIKRFAPSVSAGNNKIAKMELGCEVCHETFDTSAKFRGHLRSQRHLSNCAVCTTDGVKVIRSAFKNRIVTYRIDADDDNEKDIPTFLNNISLKVVDIFKRALQQYVSIKANMELFGRYVKDDEEDLKSFNTKYEVLVEGSDLLEMFSRFSSIIGRKSEEFQVSMQ